MRPAHAEVNARDLRVAYLLPLADHRPVTLLAP